MNRIVAARNIYLVVVFLKKKNRFGEDEKLSLQLDCILVIVSLCSPNVVFYFIKPFILSKNTIKSTKKKSGNAVETK